MTEEELQQREAQRKAEEAQRRLGGEARVLARILDLVPRLLTEKQAGRSPR